MADHRRRGSAPGQVVGAEVGSLRPAQPGDAPTIAAIWRDGWRDGHLGHVPETLVAARDDASFDRRASERIADATVATVDGCVAGFIMVVDDELEQVYVGASHRGTGIARTLLREAQRQVHAGGYRQAWLAVATGNSAARGFYERNGWHDAGPFAYSAAGEGEGEGDGAPILVPCHRYVSPTS
jgi:ribosomal protein S18 acetylase RimI-like enzyme